jgi:hypothetical protein
VVVFRLILRLAFISGLVAIASCTKPPPFEFDATVPILQQFQNRKLPEKFRGSGSVVFAFEGERYNGNADIKWSGNGTLSADFYSFFGGSVASVQVDSPQGIVRIKDRTVRFFLDDTMYSLPYRWAKQLTFRQFTQALLGKVPSIPEVEGDPDSVTQRGDFVMMVWKSEQVKISVVFALRTETVQTLSIERRTDNGPWSMEFGNFRNRLAEKIIFKDNNDSFIALDYDKVIIN